MFDRADLFKAQPLNHSDASGQARGRKAPSQRHGRPATAHTFAPAETGTSSTDAVDGFIRLIGVRFNPANHRFGTLYRLTPMGD